MADITVPGITDLRLTEWTSCGGCAAKWGAAPLAGLLRTVAGGPSAGSAADAAGLLVGLPPVDDPADFGAIAAANACSDVFAMGGRVKIALNVAAFPERLPVEAIGAIL